MVVRFLTGRGRRGGIVQPDGRVEHGQGDHGLGQEDALGHEPEHIVPGDGASDTAPGRGSAVRAADEHADAREREDGQERLGPGREREVARGAGAGAAVVLERGVAVPAIGLTSTNVSDG